MLNPKLYGKFNKYFWFYISLILGQDKIYILAVNISSDAQGKHGPDRYQIDHWRVDLPIIYFNCYMPQWAHRWYLWLIILSYGAHFLLKDRIDMMVLFPFMSLPLTRFHCFSYSWAIISFLAASTKSSLECLLVDSLPERVSLSAYMLENRRLLKLGILSG